MNSSITRDEKGTYRWTGIIDTESDKKTMGIIFGTMGGLCAFFILMGLFMSRDAMGPTLLGCAGVMAVVSVITIPLMWASKGRKQKYEMNEEYVRYVGYGRDDHYFYYKGIRQVHIFHSRSMLEVKGAIVTVPVFVPQEDFVFVKNYILHRLPDSAKVIPD